MLRNKFPQYVRPTDEELSELLSSGTIVLDSSAILNLYRYSEETRDDFLELYEHETIKPRLWLPHQVATEYMKNREGVRLEKHSDVKNLKRSITKSINDALKNARKVIYETGRGRAQHPHIDIEGLEKSLAEGFEALEKVLDEHLNEPNGQTPSRTLDDDVLYTRIENLFGEQIGEGFSEQEIEEIRKEGEKRFRLEIPPGYEDAKSKRNPYGDLIIWKELIKYAAEQGRGIIFVTDDEKDDWIAKVEGQKVGPRLELIKEMLDKAGQRFYLYTGSNFHTYAKKLIKQEPRSESVEEAKEVNQHLYGNSVMKEFLNILKAMQNDQAPLFQEQKDLDDLTSVKNFVHQVPVDDYGEMREKIELQKALMQKYRRRLDMPMSKFLKQQVSKPYKPSKLEDEYEQNDED